MSEALKKFVLSKAKNQAAFDKKFSGRDGAVALLEVLGDAPKGVVKEAQKILQSNPTDVEASAAEIAKLAFGAEAPAKRSGGIRNKKADTGERIEGTNLPQGDGGVLADPPAQPAKGRKGKKATAAPKATNEAAATEGTGQAPPQKGVAADDAELDTEIGQFVSAEGLGGVQDTGAGMGRRIVDPRVSLEVAPAPPTFLADTMSGSIGALPDMPEPGAPAPNTPAPVAQKDNPFAPAQNPVDFQSLDTSWMSASPQMSRAEALSVLGGLMDGTPESPTMQGPFRDGLFDMAGNAELTPSADSALPGTTSPDGGFLGLDQAPTQLNSDGGFMDGMYGPIDDALSRSLAQAESDRVTRLNRDAIAGAQSQFSRRQAAARLAPSGQTPAVAQTAPDPIQPVESAAPARTPRPPFYDANRTMGQWWNEPGIVSRANEFFYQRGMPGFMARSVQPTASVIDKGLKVGGPAAIGLGAAYGGLKGLQAISSMGEENAIAPPTDEEMAATESALAAAEARVRRMMQPPGNPASMPSQPPVQ